MNKIITVMIISFLLFSGSLLAQMTPPGNALQFDGRDDYVNTTLWANGGTFPNTIWTIECWVKGTHDPESSKMDGPIYGDQSFAILWDYQPSEFRGTASVCTRSGSYSFASFGPLVGGVWYHLSATYDRYNLRAYKNGVLVTTTYAPGAAPYYAGYPVSIGSHPLPSNGHFQGFVDEVRIWNVVRTEDEIRSNMNNVVSSLSPGLLAYYNFDQTRGETLPNLVSSNYTGTLSNGPMWTESYAMVVPVAKPATDVMKHSFTANWNAPAIGTVEKYFIDVSTDPNFNSFFPGYSNKDVGNTLSYNISVVNYGTYYYYRVRAYKASVGYGNYSAAITVVTLPNTLPIANAGPDQTIDCAPIYGATYVTLDGSRSYDPDHDPIANYEWKDYTGRIIDTGVNPQIYFPSGVHSIFLTVKDAEGWPGVADEVIITINSDRTPPVPNVPQLPDIVGECSVTLVSPMARDNCSGTIIGTTTQPLSYTVQGTYTVTWSYADANGNTTQQIQKAIVKDITPPVLTAPSALTTYRNSIDGYTGSIGRASAIDNCSAAPVIACDAPQLFPLGVTKVTWRAVDDVGNISSAEQLVTVVNREPVANAGVDRQFNCISTPQISVTLNGSASSDADSDQLIYTWTENGNSIAGGVTPSINLGDGTHSILLTVNDGNGGIANDEVLVIVNLDKQAPVITLPPDVIVETNISGGYIGNTGTATAIDICDGQVSVTSNAPQTFPIGITKVTWTAKDAAGNIANAIQQVTVTTHPPFANAGNDQKFDCAPKNGVTVQLDGSASSDPDNDPLTFVWLESGNTIASGVKPQINIFGGVHTIKLTVNDGFGGIAVDEVIVTVNVDNEAPKIIAPNAITKIANIAGGYSGSIGTATAIDNCDGSPVISNNTPQILPLDITKVVWTATDANGNSSKAEQLVTVEAIPVIVDVKPGEGDAPINLKSKGKIPVAIITGGGFDAANVDKATVKFGPNKTPVLMGNLEDVDKDGDLDLMLHFDNESTGIIKTDTKVELIGKTKTGVDLKGSDNIKIVGNLKKERAESEIDELLPTEYMLSQNYPNPFNPVTVIKYQLPEAGYVSLKVYDVLGREVATLVNEYQQPGNFVKIFNGKSLPSGIYFYRIQTEQFTQTRKLILMK